MATTVARLEAVLQANTRDFDRGMDRSQSKMSKVGKAAGVAGLAIAGGLAVGLTKSVRAAMDAEQAQARLETAFKRAKVPIDKHREAIEKASDAAVNLGFDDEDLKRSLGSLIIATGSYQKAQIASNVAMDLARFKGVSLEQSTKMLTMAMAGSQRAIKQLGISVSPVTAEYDKLKAQFGAHISAAEKVALAQAKINDKQATAAKTIDIVNQKVKGQADAYASTAQGGIEVFKQKLEELEENIGTTLLPAFTRIINKLISTLSWLQKHPAALKAVVVGLAALAAALLTAAAAQAALNLAVLANPYVAATVAIIALAAGAALLYTKFKQLRPELEFFAETIAGVPLPLRLALLAMGGVQGAVDKLRGPVMKLADAFHTVLNFLSPVVDLMKWVINNAKKLGDIWGGITSGLSKLDPRSGDADANTYKKVLLGGGMGTGPKSIDSSLYDELGTAQRMGLHLTSGYRPGARTKHGTRSDHSVYPSKAIDVADGPSQMARFFMSLIGDRGVKQAFYDPLGSIFGGVLNSYREGGHSDHVHVATYDKGGWLQPGWNLAYNGLGKPEPVGAGVGNINLYVDGQRLFQWFKNTERRDNRRNSR